jgi:prophage antirepressor-like protein
MVKQTKEDEKYIYFLDYFRGNRIEVMKDKISGEIFFNADDVVRCLGIGNTMNEFLSSDEGLDWINELKKEYPCKTVFGEHGMFRKKQQLKS